MTRRAAAVMAVALALVAATGPPPALAQAPPGADLRVIDLDGSLAPGEPLSIRMEVHNPTAGSLTALSVGVEALSRTTSRSDLRRVMESSPSRTRLGGVERPLEPIPPGEVLTLDVRLEPGELGLADAAAGVYPLALTLRAADGVVEELRTSVVLPGATVGEPVRLALVVPVTGPSGVLPDGRVRVDPLAGDLQDGGRLPALAATLADAPAVPVTLSTDALILAAAEDAVEGYTAVDTAGVVDVPPGAPPAERAAAFVEDVRAVLSQPRAQQLALPYGAADLVAMARAGQPDAVERAVDHGRSQAEDLTGTAVSPTTLHPPGGLTPEVLAAARRAGVDTVVAGGDELVPSQPGALSPSPVQSIAADGDSAGLTALVGDAWLAGALTWRPAAGSPGDPGPVLRAQRILSELAALYFERPFGQEVRGVVVVAPLDWDPDPVMLGRAFNVLRDAPREAPWVKPVTLAALGREVAPAPAPAVLRPDRAEPLSVGLMQAVGAARATLDSLSAVLTGPEEQVRAERLLWAAGSVHARGREPAALDLVEAVTRAASQVLTAVEVVPGPQIILTSRREQMPVTVRNTGGLPVQVRVAARSTAYSFPDGAVSAPLTVPAEETRQVDLTVETLRPGATAPVDVMVTDVTGDRVLAQGQVVVRSTATSPVAVVITLGAGLFLALWWVQDARRRRSGQSSSRADKGAGATGVHSAVPH